MESCPVNLFVLTKKMSIGTSHEDLHMSASSLMHVRMRVECFKQKTFTPSSMSHGLQDKQTNWLLYVHLQFPYIMGHYYYY